jgi:hypothetical protein
MRCRCSSGSSAVRLLRMAQMAQMATSRDNPKLRTQIEAIGE